MVLVGITLGLFFSSSALASEVFMTPILQESGTKMTLLDTFFLDTKNGWAVGAGGTMLRTEDGGVAWKAIPRRTPVLLMSVYFSDNTHGWVIGQYGAILHSRDG